MTNVQRIQVKMSEIRQAINALTEEAEAADFDKLTKEYQKLESEYRAALIVESAESEESNHPNNDTPEGREIGRILARASITDYVKETLSGVKVEGASKELREATLGENIEGYMPLDLLLPRAVEHRADVVSNVASAIQENQMSIAGRVFARSSAEYLGVNSPTVPGRNRYLPSNYGGNNGRRKK